VVAILFKLRTLLSDRLSKTCVIVSIIEGYGFGGDYNDAGKSRETRTRLHTCLRTSRTSFIMQDRTVAMIHITDYLVQWCRKDNLTHERR